MCTRRIATFGLSQSEFQRQVQGFLYKIRRTKRTDDDANDAETNAVLNLYFVFVQENTDY